LLPSPYFQTSSKIKPLKLFESKNVEESYGPFFGFNRSGANVSQGVIDWFWFQGMQAGHKNAFDCIKAFSEIDFTEDLQKIRCADADCSWR
jgi:hypothetical protein